MRGEAMSYTTVGKRVNRTDAWAKVQGSTVYGVDLKLPRMLYGKALYSPYAHARIININTTEARNLPGVLAVVTGADVPYTYGSTVKDRPFVALEKVRFQGEPVAAVAAVDQATAEKAVQLVKVEYEPLEPLLDAEKALDKDAFLVHPDLGKYKHSYAATPVPGTNIVSHFKLRKGDAEAGFAGSDLVIEGTYRTQMVQHGCMEPHVAIAQVDSFSGDITIWSGTVSPFIARMELAQAMGVSMNRIRIIVPAVGGSFGSKMYLKLEPIAVALSGKCGGRPVKMVFGRDEEFFAGVVKGPTITRLKTGVKKDGTIVARKVVTIWDTGAYGECGPRITRNGGHTSAGPYRIPNVSIDGYCMYTNKNIGGAFRGYGVQEVAWAYESHTDEIAQQLGMDPVEFRLKNLLVDGDEGATGQKVVAAGISECLKRAAKAINWGVRTAAPGRARGKGVATIHKATGMPSTSAAFIKFNEDGTVVLSMSTIEQGQGSETIMAQIAAEELGVSFSDVRVTQADTLYTPFDSSTTSSRSTFYMGNAIRLAAEDVRSQLLTVAGKILDADPGCLEIRDGVIVCADDGSGRMALKEIISKHFGARGGTLLGRGVFRPEGEPMDPETGQTRKITPYWMYAAQAAEVEVDCETGKVEVLNLVAAHDVGKAINPVNCEQQIEGSLVMGMGGAVSEEVLVGGTGLTLNANFHDYKMPTALDVPPMESILVEYPHPDGPYGAKGLGEPGLAPTAPAIANAVFNALGIRITDLPLTPEKVLMLIKAGKKMGNTISGGRTHETTA